MSRTSRLPTAIILNAKRNPERITDQTSVDPKVPPRNMTFWPFPISAIHGLQVADVCFLPFVSRLQEVNGFGGPYDQTPPGLPMHVGNRWN